MTRTALGFVLLALILGGAAHAWAASAFRTRTRSLVEGLGAVSVGRPLLLDAPPVVRSYARRAAPIAVVPAKVRLNQQGAMRARPGAPWRPFTAEQIMSVREVGFVWCARVGVAPLVTARVADAYVRGQGFLEVRLLGSLRVAHVEGPEMDRAELMRYLAELAWVPEALLGNPELHWRDIDATTVEVSAESASGPARVRLGFENNRLARAEADDRPHEEGGRLIPRPWVGRFFDHVDIDGHLVPRRAEASWVLEDGPFAYWRGEVTTFEVV